MLSAIRTVVSLVGQLHHMFLVISIEFNAVMSIFVSVWSYKSVTSPLNPKQGSLQSIKDETCCKQKEARSLEESWSLGPTKTKHPFGISPACSELLGITKPLPSLAPAEHAFYSGRPHCSKADVVQKSQVHYWNLLIAIQLCESLLILNSAGSISSGVHLGCLPSVMHFASKEKIIWPDTEQWCPRGPPRLRSPFELHPRRHRNGHPSAKAPTPAGLSPSVCLVHKPCLPGITRDESAYSTAWLRVEKSVRICVNISRRPFPSI